MSLLNDALGAAGGSGFDIGALAAKVGLSEQQAKMVLQALAKFANQPGDTAEQASAETGVEKSKVEQLLSAVGGEGAVAKLGGALGGGGLGGLFG
ncbi:hypothetical protein [Stakelama saccharophila]|uniref:Uncharacterized protein n=1 Tax=Stakelama saccharophila TaxID=3075605 RepID=A0ABZ0BE15_9SPHN|nr:hypothetical protein [Stakelama sp. W311]WNO54594.1 hypothetical protein RPR59_04910 [Stakelama sp. W311]